MMLSGHSTRGTRCSRPQPRAVHTPLRPHRIAQHVAVTTHVSRADGLLLGALDKALNQIVSIIQDHERKQLKLAAQRSAAGESTAEVETAGKMVKFNASSNSERPVQEPAPGINAAGRGLDAYLALDLDQYALLDPRWITRPNPDTAPDVFVLKVPLHDLMHVQLEPQVTIKVTIDAPNSKVKFQASSFKLGDVRFDDSFTLDMDAVLSHKPVSDIRLGMMSAFQGWGKDTGLTRLPDKTSAPAYRGQPTDIEVVVLSPVQTQAQAAQGPSSQPLETTQTLDSTAHQEAGPASLPGDAAAGAPGSEQQGGGVDAAAGQSSAPDAQLGSGLLCCKVDMRFSVVMPSPVSVVPGPLLSLAGGLLANLALKSLLPAFLELLSVDYVKWATGTGNRQQAAGSLLSSAPAPGPGAAATQAAAGLVLSTAAERGSHGDTQEGDQEAFPGGLAGQRLGTAMATGVAAAVTLASDAVQTSQ